MAIGAAAVWNALKLVGEWALSNSGTMMGIAERISTLRASKDKDEYIATMDEKIDQLGTATVELDEKLTLMREELEAARKEAEMLKKILLAMGIVLGLAVVAIVISFIV